MNKRVLYLSGLIFVFVFTFTFTFVDSRQAYASEEIQYRCCICPGVEFGGCPTCEEIEGCGGPTKGIQHLGPHGWSPCEQSWNGIACLHNCFGC